jgi:ATP-binding cassette, subfamily G (WHITE), member 2, SNQ2
MIFVQVVVFGIIMYFMTNLDVNVSKFFIFELFIFVTTICITALYRMFAALSPTIDDAVRFSGLGKQLLVPKIMALRTKSGGRLDNGDTWCQR